MDVRLDSGRLSETTCQCGLEACSGLDCQFNRICAHHGCATVLRPTVETETVQNSFTEEEYVLCSSCFAQLTDEFCEEKLWNVLDRHGFALLFKCGSCDAVNWDYNASSYTMLSLDDPTVKVEFCDDCYLSTRQTSDGKEWKCIDGGLTDDEFGMFLSCLVSVYLYLINCWCCCVLDLCEGCEDDDSLRKCSLCSGYYDEDDDFVDLEEKGACDLCGATQRILEQLKYSGSIICQGACDGDCETCGRQDVQCICSESKDQVVPSDGKNYSARPPVVGADTTKTSGMLVLLLFL